MIYQWRYETPTLFTNMRMQSDGTYLTELVFEESLDVRRKTLAFGEGEDCKVKEIPVLRDTCHWLDIYFRGKDPDFTPEYRIPGLTPFRREVSEIMRKIPFGNTTTYGAIAEQLAKKHGKAHMSAQAVGGAVGWNPLCLIVPCHRVVGAGGSLTGYGGGIQNKKALLELEGNDMSRFFVPTRGTAL